VGRRYPTIATAVTALIAQACGLVTANHDPAQDNPPVAGSPGQSGAGATGGAGATSGNGSAGTLSIGGSLIDVPPDCPTVQNLFDDQVVNEVGQARKFYSWTTAEQVAELRAGGELFSRSERPGMGRGLLFSELATLAESDASTVQALADALVNKVFVKARFAWTNPWATLMGFPGEQYGDQLLQVELKPDAWIARFEGQDLRVFDAQNQDVPLETALLTPERIGAIFYQSRSDAQQRYCGTFSHGSVGFREFALGNIDMVARWSLATPDITERLKSDIAELEKFEQQIACYAIPSDWASGVGCDWSRSYPPGETLGNYEFALGLPSELYRPSPENLSALIAALRASMPTGKPLDVTPGQ
jgi:hypothetical protein